MFSGRGPKTGPRVLGDSYFIGTHVTEVGKPVKYTRAELIILDIQIRHSGLIVPEYVKEAIKELKIKESKE